MSKSNLAKKVDWLGKMIAGLMVVVLLLIIAMAIGKLPTPDVELLENRGPTEPIIEEAKPEKEVVPDAVAIASLKDYASLETERMAKMAAALMDMGGEYEASCSAAQDTRTGKTEIVYRITWGRVPDDKPNETPQIWSGASWKGGNWAECLAKMMAWKKGGE